MELVILISASSLLVGHFVLTKSNAAIEYRLACLLLALVNAIFVGANAMYRLLDPASFATLREVLDHHHETIGMFQATMIIVSGASVAMVAALLIASQRRGIEVGGRSHNWKCIAVFHALAIGVLIVITACPNYLHLPFVASK